MQTAAPVVSRAKAYLKVRHKSVRDAMKELKLDGMLLTHPPDLAYLTNFTGDDSIGADHRQGLPSRHRLPLRGAGRARGRLAQDRRPRRQDGRGAGQGHRRGQGASASASRPTSPPSGRSTRSSEAHRQGRQAEGRAGAARRRDDQHPQGEGRSRDRPDPQDRSPSPRRRSRRSATRSSPGRPKIISPGCWSWSCAAAGRATAAFRRSSPPARTARCRTIVPARRWCSAISRCCSTGARCTRDTAPT